MNIIKDDLNAHFLEKRAVAPGTDASGFPDLSRTGGASDPVLKPELLNIFLVNLEENRSHRPPELWQVMELDGALRASFPPAKLDVYFLVASKFKDYPTALDHLTLCIRYFLAHRYYDRISHPDFPVEIERLIVEMIPMTFEMQRAVWSSLQVAYLPSVLFRMGLMVMPDQSDSPALPLVTEVIGNAGRMP